MSDFRYLDRVRLAAIDPAMPPERHACLGEVGRITGGPDRKGNIRVKFDRPSPDWEGSMVPASLLENLTLRDDPMRERPTPIGRAGLPGFDGMHAMRNMGGLAFKSVEPRNGRWGRARWKGRNDFHETLRYEVRLDGKVLGEVWRASGVSYMSTRHVWFADTALGKDMMASTIHGADDMRTSRALAGLNVAGAALLQTEIAGAKVAPVSVVLGNGFDEGCYLVGRPDGKAQRLWLHWEDPKAPTSRDPGYRATCSVKGEKGWSSAAFRDEASWEPVMEQAVRAILGEDPEPDIAPGM
jgi:hypothetical protein